MERDVAQQRENTAVGVSDLTHGAVGDRDYPNTAPLNQIARQKVAGSYVDDHTLEKAVSLSYLAETIGVSKPTVWRREKLPLS